MRGLLDSPMQNECGILNGSILQIKPGCGDDMRSLIRHPKRQNVLRQKTPCSTVLATQYNRGIHSSPVFRAKMGTAVQLLIRPEIAEK